MADKLTRMIKNLPSFYAPEVNTNLRGLLSSWGLSDDDITVQLQNTKDQLFVKRASGRNLDGLGSNVGVDRTPALGIQDDDFRKLIPVLSFLPKQVRSTILELLDIFWGPLFTRPNVTSGNVETYNFGPSSTEGGTANFRPGNKTVIGTGTNFTLNISPGDYIKPLAASGTSYQKVSEVIDDTTLILSKDWEGDIAIASDVEIGVVRTLSYKADNKDELIIRFTPNAFEDLSAVTIEELSNFINNSQEHNSNITASEFLDPVAGSKLNIRTNTPGLQGSIQITGGDANDVTRLNFDLDRHIDTKVKVVEINPNEVIIQIPASVPVLRRSLKGSVHPRQTKSEIFSDEEVYDFSGVGASSTLELEVNGNPETVTFTTADFNDSSAVTAKEISDIINLQLSSMQAFAECQRGSIKRVGLRTSEGNAQYQITGGTANAILNFTTDLQEDPELLQTNRVSSYVFNPGNESYTVTGTNSQLSTKVDEGTIQATLNLDDASGFPNQPGQILLDFGRNKQEGPINYNSRPNNSTLLIDASHIFQKSHLVGAKVNLVKSGGTTPRLTGDDYAMYITGTQAAREAAQDIIRSLLASGVVVRFIIDFPEYLFECICRDCGPSEDPDYRGVLTGQGPLVF